MRFSKIWPVAIHSPRFKSPQTEKAERPQRWLCGQPARMCVGHVSALPLVVVAAILAVGTGERVAMPTERHNPLEIWVAALRRDSSDVRLSAAYRLGELGSQSRLPEDVIDALVEAFGVSEGQFFRGRLRVLLIGNHPASLTWTSAGVSIRHGEEGGGFHEEEGVVTQDGLQLRHRGNSARVGHRESGAR